MPRNLPSIIDLGQLDGLTGVKFDGINNDDRSGASISSAGDLNGDGYVDIIIAAAHADSNGDTKNGEVYIVWGKQGRWPATFKLAYLNGTNGVIFRNFGGTLSNPPISVATIDDFNGDNIADVIFGVKDLNKAFVVFGHRGVWPNIFDLSNLNGTNGFVVTTQQKEYRGIGQAVASAGDVNNDGLKDIILGAPLTRNLNNGDPSIGGAHVIFAQQNYQWPAVFNVETLSGRNGFALQPSLLSSASNQVGRVVASLGDFNGDGIDDFLLACRDDRANEANKFTVAYIVFGRVESWPANIDLAALDGNNGVTIYATEGYTQTLYTANAAGDVNGDGFGDLLLASPTASPGGRAEAGQIHVIFGSKKRWPASFTMIKSSNDVYGVGGYEAIFDIDFGIINGVTAYDQCGTVLSGAGDVDGDGIDDMLVASTRAVVSDQAKGKVYLVYGQKSWRAEVQLSALNGNNGVAFNSAYPSQLFVAPAGDINQDGLHDLLMSSPDFGYREQVDLNWFGQTYLVFSCCAELTTTPTNVATTTGPMPNQSTNPTVVTPAPFSTSTASNTKTETVTTDVTPFVPTNPSNNNQNASSTFFTPVPFSTSTASDAKTETVTTDVTPFVPTNPNDNNDQSAAIIAGILGGFLLLIVIFLLTRWLYNRYQDHKQRSLFWKARDEAVNDDAVVDDRSANVRSNAIGSSNV